jgi:hypothetical protein
MRASIRHGPIAEIPDAEVIHGVAVAPDGSRFI